MNVVVVGAGIGGLALALELHDAGIPCTVYESVSEIDPLGVGINVLPHASAILSRLGLQDELAAVGITTQESAFFTRFGQLIHREPSGIYAGYQYPQFSIHRGDLQKVLLRAVRERLGEESVLTGHRAVSVTQDRDRVRVTFDVAGGESVVVDGTVVVGCDGIHSAIRKQYFPNENAPRYSGVNMWRGVTLAKPFLSGASMVRAGWLSPGKLVAYPIRDNVDGSGMQLINWVAEVETPHHLSRDWNRRGSIDDFISAFEDWHFDWLDVPELIRGTDEILEYPMVDQDSLDRWSFDRVTLLGDAAHPMVPRGSNGAGQAILDARALRLALEQFDDEVAALQAYDDQRRPATAQVVHMNRTAPPDILLKEVRDRSNDQPFSTIDDVISREEIDAISLRYKQVAGFTIEDVGGE